jgi:hypothetical protein
LLQWRVGEADCLMFMDFCGAHVHHYSNPKHILRFIYFEKIMDTLSFIQQIKQKQEQFKVVMHQLTN